MGDLNTTLTFGAPAWFLALPAVIFSVTGFLWLHRRRVARLSRWVRRDLWSVVFPGFVASKLPRKIFWLGIALLFASLALTRPRLGIESSMMAAKSLDIAIVLDLSNSMNAEDVAPSRLRVAKRAINALLRALPGDRFALIGFAGRANVLSPLTTDLDYVSEILETADPSDLRPQGSNLGAALIAARDVHTSASEHPHGRVVVMFSDGEDHEGTFREAAEKLKASAAVAAVVAVGTDRGAPVPTRDASGRLSAYLKDSSGQTVVSRVAVSTLKLIAEHSGAALFDLSRGESAIDDLIAFLRRAERGELGQTAQPIFRERYQVPLAVALVALLWEMWGGAAALRLVVLLCFGFMVPSFFGRDARAGERANSFGAYRQNKRGLEKLEQKDPRGAAEFFSEGRRLDPDSPTLDFNEGAARLGAGDAEGSLGASQEAQSKAEQQKNEELFVSSAYNRGAALEKLERREEAVKAYLEGLRRATDTGQKDLAEKLRKKLEQSATQKEKKKPEEQEGDSKPQPDQPPESGNSPQQKRFRSDNLTRDDAERIMKELAAREQALKEKLGKPKGKPQENLEKDW